MATLSMTAVIASERYSDIVTLNAGTSNFMEDEDNVIQVALPAGFGDCLLLECQLYVANASSANARITNYDPASDAYIVDGVGLPMALVDTAQLFETGVLRTGFSCHWDPSQPVLWRSLELFYARYPSLTDGGGDTADMNVYLTVRRLRTPGRI